MNANPKPVDEDSSALAGGPSLGLLLEQVRQHDGAASRRLVAHLYPTIARVVHSHLPRRDEPEDLMQEIFMKVFSRLDQYRGDAPFEHWVSRLALTTCLDRLRRQRVRPELRWADLEENELRVLQNSIAPAEATDADTSGAAALIEKLLGQLSASDAWLIRQVELEQRSLAEVCAEAGWNAGLTRVRLFRARHRLRKALLKFERLAHET